MISELESSTTLVRRASDIALPGRIVNCVGLKLHSLTQMGAVYELYEASVILVHASCNVALTRHIWEETINRFFLLLASNLLSLK